MSAEPSIVIEHCIADDVKVSKKRSIDAISIETDTTKRQKYNSANDTKRADDNDGESATPSSASAGASTSASAGASTGRTKVGQRWATNDAYELGRKNALPADKDIKMDEPPHKYYMRGSSRFMTSVTTIIGKYHPPFERDAIADKLAKTKKYRAMGMDADAIKASWKRAADLGTMLHAAIEQFYNGETPDLSQLETRKEWDMFLKFHEEVVVKRGWEMYHPEHIVFAPDLFLAGSIDGVFLLKNKNGDLCLVDWKRTKNIREEPKTDWKTGDMKMCFGPANTVPLCKTGKYSIQLNFYKWIYETYYGVKVSEMYIVAFHPHTQTDYIMIPVPPMPEVVEGIVKERREEVKMLLAREETHKQLESFAKWAFVVADPEWCGTEKGVHVMQQHLQRLQGLENAYIDPSLGGKYAQMQLKDTVQCAEMDWRNEWNARVSDGEEGEGEEEWDEDVCQRELRKLKVNVLVFFDDDIDMHKDTTALFKAAQTLGLLTVVVSTRDVQYFQSQE